MPSRNTESSESDSSDSPGPSTQRFKSFSKTKSTPQRTKPVNQGVGTPSGSAKRKTSAPRKSTPRRRRYRPGMKALREIRELQKSTKLCIQKLPFSRLVREIQQRVNPTITHWQVTALEALQEACEVYVVRFLEDCNEAAVFASRKTILLRDSQFINKLRGRHGVI